MKAILITGIVSLLFCLFILTANTSAAPSASEIEKIEQAVATLKAEKPAKSRKLLVIDKCNAFVHSSIPYWDEALKQIGEKTGAYEVFITDDVSFLDADNLKQFDAVCLNNTTKLTVEENDRNVINNPNTTLLTESQKKSLMDFVKNGGGFIGIHAASDNFYGWEEAIEMVGNIFKGHPWGANGTWGIKVDDPEHPLCKPFKNTQFKLNDEIYRTPPTYYSREKFRVLVSLDMSDEKTKNARGVQPDDMDTGISWIRDYGKGRVFYTGFGHTHHTTWNPEILGHVLLGIQFALGDLDVDTTPLVGNGQASAASSDLDITGLLNPAKNYQFGEDRKPLVQIHNAIAEVYGSPADLAAAEEQIIAALKSESSLAFKDFLVRELAIIGTERSVPVLSDMLIDPKQTNLARYALEKIPSEKAEQVLIKNLSTSNKEIKIGIITSLGARGSGKAVPEIQSNIFNSDTDIAFAAISALGRIGNKAAAEALQTGISKIPGDLQHEAENALLKCGEKALNEKRTRDATAIFSALFKSKADGLIRSAALAGLVAADNQVDASLVVALKDNDIRVQNRAILLACEVNNAMAMAQAKRQMSQFDPELQIRFLGALEKYKRPLGRDIAVQFMDAENDQVRLASISALAVLGDETSIEPLAKKASSRAGKEEIDAAHDALVRLPGGSIDSAILSMIQKGGDSRLIAELIQVAGDRGSKSALPVFMKLALDDDRTIKRACLEVIPSLAEPKDMQSLIPILKQQPDSQTETMIVLVAVKAPEREGSAAEILKAMNTTSNVKIKASLLRVMGAIGDPESLSVLRSMMNDSNAELQEAAFRGLTEWPGDEALPDMKKMVTQGKDDRTKILAYRVYIRMIRESDKSNTVKFNGISAAMEMAPRPDERKAVLAAIGDLNTADALDFAMAYIQDSDIKAEAQAAAINICQRIGRRNRTKCRQALAQIEEAAVNDTIRSRAAALQNRM